MHDLLINSKIFTTGVKICGDLSFPKTQQRDAPYFPLTGPASAHLSIEKADTHKSYVFEARVETEKERREGDELNNIYHYYKETIKYNITICGSKCKL